MQTRHLIILLLIALGWAILPFLLKSVAMTMSTPVAAMLYCGGIGVLAIAIALGDRRRAARELRTMRLSTIALVAVAAVVGVFCTYNFIDSIANPEQHATSVVLITYCLPVILAGAIAVFLYKEAISPIGYGAALLTLAAIYVFSRYGFLEPTRVA